MAQGAAGEVTITRNEKRNRYEAKITTGKDPITGRSKRQLIVGRTRTEVKRRMKAAMTAVDEGRSPKPEKRTVAQYLNDWADDVLPGTVANSTEVNYRNIIRLYITPTIGHIDLAQLTPTDVSKMLRKLEDKGASGNTRRLARSVLRRALRRAEQEGIITRNVAAIADGVKVESKPGRSLTVEQARTLLEAAGREHNGAAWIVALTLGLRRGEVLALCWDDLDLGDKPVLTITRTLKRVPGVGLELSEPKTKGSRRRIHIPAPTVRALKAHRKTQLEERLVVGSSWPDKPLGADLVFRTPLGTAVDPDNFRNQTYGLTLDALGERWSPHELRHSAASLLIAQGVPIKIISEVLGHSSIRITSDVYGHLFDDAGLVAADAMTELLG